MDPDDADLTRRFYAAYRNPQLAVLEGFHPARHALRFGARLDVAVTYDAQKLFTLAERLAPESIPAIEDALRVVTLERFSRLSQRSLSSPLLSICARPHYDIAAVLAERTKPAVHLDRPRNPGNVGAVVRVAAAADLAAVTVSGQDPWSPVAIRSATGLQFALPVAFAELAPSCGRPIVALDVGSDPLDTGSLPPDSILVVGGERHGLPGWIREVAHRSVGLPMKPGVSSLNLATALAAVLYSWRISAFERDGRYPW
ncbi:MAG TPA: TrmH family RNA methyltransferase [Acidimicrobiales bacterium]|nr:TrmH family RNA methyltransferase [Acidimicrobiales bacterium]